jgi:hypothetical protein
LVDDTEGVAAVGTAAAVVAEALAVFGGFGTVEAGGVDGVGGAASRW